MLENDGGNQTLLPTMEVPICTTACQGEPHESDDEPILDLFSDYGDAAVGEDRFLAECPYRDLTKNFCSRREKVVAVLNVVRRREITEKNPKTGWRAPTRFCESFNIAFFDFDKESKVVHGPLLHEIPPSKYRCFDDSVNVISIKVTQSDVRYPIKIYGTVLARDVNDYRCVYLFKRGRDDPQLITRKNRMLALTGPYRALGGRDYMYFEFNLKIKSDGPVDDDFSKGLVVRCAYRSDSDGPTTFSLGSYLSTVHMVCMHVPFALEASIGVNFLNGKSNFTGKIFASTSGSPTTKMVLYDSQLAGTKTELRSGGSVPLSRRIVAVPFGEDLLLYFCVRDSHDKSRRLKFVIRNGVDERTCNLGTYKLQLKIIWKGVFRQEPAVLKHRGGAIELW